MVYLYKSAYIFKMRHLWKLTLFKVIDKIEIFFYGHIHIKGRKLREIAYLLFSLDRVFKDVYAVYKGFAVCTGYVACKDIHGGGFSRSVRTEEAENFSVLSFKRDIIDSLFVAVSLGKVYNLYHFISSS